MILPLDPAEIRIRNEAADAAAVLKAVEAQNCDEADVFACSKVCLLQCSSR
jgi:hypothetical protein